MSRRRIFRRPRRCRGLVCRPRSRRACRTRGHPAASSRGLRRVCDRVEVSPPDRAQDDAAAVGRHELLANAARRDWQTIASGKDADDDRSGKRDDAECLRAKTQNSFFGMDLKFFFCEKNLCEKLFWEYVFKLIVDGIVYQQNCLKIGRNRCRERGMRHPSSLTRNYSIWLRNLEHHTFSSMRRLYGKA